MADGATVFAADIGKWFDSLGDNLDRLVKESAGRLAQEVVTTTPVDTGFLRGSWQPSLGVPTVSMDDGETDPAGAKSLARIAAVIAGMSGNVLYVVNNARYAMRVEYGFVGPDSLGRVYNQPGRFFLTQAVARWQQIVTQVATDMGAA